MGAESISNALCVFIHPALPGLATMNVVVLSMNGFGEYTHIHAHTILMVRQKRLDFRVYLVECQFLSWLGPFRQTLYILGTFPYTFTQSTHPHTHRSSNRRSAFVLHAPNMHPAVYQLVKIYSTLWILISCENWMNDGISNMPDGVA